MNTTRYGAIVDGKRGAYGVVIPDLPGCTAMGKTLDEALASAASAAVAWATIAGSPIPKPRALEQLHRDPDVRAAINAGGTLVIVPLILDSSRPVRANLSLDAGTLQAIDDAARARDLSRSAFMVSAAREKIVADG